MTKLLITKPFWMIALLAVWAHAQVVPPADSPVSPSVSKSDNASVPPMSTGIDDDSSAHRVTGRVSLIRGVLKKVDPIRDQLLVHTFGGGDVRIAFDGRTQLHSDDASSHLTSLPVGTVVSVDTQLADGKLFARAVQTGKSDAIELSGKVMGYDVTRSQLTLHDPMSPEDVSLRITPTTTVMNHGQSAALQTLTPGMLVQVWFTAAQKAANRIEILAKPGESFTFEGRIISVDLRARILSLSNNTDQSLRELAFGALDANSTKLLREGADVNIQAAFDGDRYNIHSVAPVTHNP